MAYTMGYALFGALLTALALVPGTWPIWRSASPAGSIHNHWLERLTVRYDRVLAACLDQPRIIYGVVIFALLAVVGLGGHGGTRFSARSGRGRPVAAGTDADGAGLEQGQRPWPATCGGPFSSIRKSPMWSPRPAATTTAPIPGPCRTSRRRSASSPTIPGRRANPRGCSWTAWRRASTGTCRAIRSASVNPSSTASNDLIGGAHSPLVIKIYGDDLDELRSIGAQIVDVLYHIQGTSSASIFQEPPIPQMEIKLDHEKAARYGVNMTDVQNVHPRPESVRRRSPRSMSVKEPIL